MYFMYSFPGLQLYTQLYILVQLLQLVYNAPINVSPHPRMVGNFPCLEWQTCPKGQDIESLKCACAIRIVRVRAVQCHASLACIALCPYASTLFDRRYAWPSTRGYFIKYVWRRKFLSPSAITTIIIVAFTTPDPSIALDSAPIYNDAAVLARAIRILVPSNPLSLPVYAPCTREGFEFECCPVGGAIELLIR